MSTYGPKRRRGGYGSRFGRIYYMITVRDGEPMIKIGISNAVLRRVRNLGGILLAVHDGSGEVEAEIHARFAADAIGGEWFRPSPALLLHICLLPRRPRTEVEAEDEAARAGKVTLDRLMTKGQR